MFNQQLAFCHQTDRYHYRKSCQPTAGRQSVEVSCSSLFPVSVAQTKYIVAYVRWLSRKRLSECNKAFLKTSWHNVSSLDKTNFLNNGDQNRIMHQPS